ncbi:MAG: extracellular solute-binding protein [Candidatus Nealsonbacteria bacterium]|nr:extracellular solute-binding protein [Candidatus Nealsonbacteria bacterium]
MKNEESSARFHHSSFIIHHSALLCVVAGICLSLAGCWSSSESEVVVYTALDSEFSQPIFDDFQQQADVTVRAKFDVESTKTVGLTAAIIEERNRPRCDVFWNNEIINTLLLKRKGLLEVYRPAIAEKYPAAFRSDDGTWHGFAARARVLIVNKEKMPDPQKWPTSIRDLADPKWRGNCCIAKPLAGTTASHAACLFAAWGDEQAKEFFRKLKANDVSIRSGNKDVARKVSAGQFAFGLTDTDDAIIEIEQGRPVAIVYPDQGKDGLGTLFIPNTVAIIKGGPNPEQARRLVDYVLSAAVEKKLAEGRSAQIPLNPEVEAKVRVKTPQTIKPMQIDFEAAAEKWDTAAEFLAAEFAAP